MRSAESAGRSGLSNASKTIILLCSLLLGQCDKNMATNSVALTENLRKEEMTLEGRYTIEQTLSEEAQRNTIAFDGLAFLTGSVGSQSFLPPGKVADYSGFQYLRDNDPTNLGHNTSFVTIIANTVLNILSTEQINLFVASARDQIDNINQFAFKRFPLLDAFRRLQQDNLPAGTTQLSKEAVMAYTAELYRVDGQISYGRAQLFGRVINSLTGEQKAELAGLVKLNGVGHWNADHSNPLEDMHLDKDMQVAVMTYASEMFAWYTGSVAADEYFCPERQGTYFGSFYLKDWPAMGNPNYSIDEQLTASAGQNFLNILTPTQAAQVRGLVSLQRQALTELVGKREAIATELRRFLENETADESKVLTLSETYGELDGEISYYYAVTFTQVWKSLTDDQKTQLFRLADELGYLAPDGAFLYSEPIPMPEIINTDFIFN
jgi:hypothetical protein